MSSAASTVPVVLELDQYFSVDYLAAVKKFRNAINARKGALYTYQHPTAKGPNGETLSVDVGVLGDENAKKAMIVISGTHGLEGLCGSAAQIGWLRSKGAGPLPADMKMIFIHTINPWGVAHGSRTTENNVDLNRNFIDFTAPLPENPKFADLHEACSPTTWTNQSIATLTEALQAFAQQHGEDGLFDTMARGQYDYRDGINYGGHQREWSNLILQQIIEAHADKVEKAGLIDWHTGLGECGEPFFLCFNDKESDLFERACTWWGHDRVVDQKPMGLEQPDYTGLVFQGTQHFLKGAQMCGAVVEFGTRGPGMFTILQLDRWLKFEGARGSELFAMLHADLKDAFLPVETSWRYGVLEEAITITQLAVDGVAHWD